MAINFHNFVLFFPPLSTVYVFPLIVVQIVQRSLPKKLKVKNDPAVIEKAERDKIRKVWINIVRRDIPKHHRVFTTFHRKQSIDAKRFADGCQREVIEFDSHIMALPTHLNCKLSFSCISSYSKFSFAVTLSSQVRMKVARSFKLPRSAPIRTRKISRDMLLFWKRYDKQMVHFLFSMYSVVRLQTAN